LSEGGLGTLVLEGFQAEGEFVAAGAGLGPKPHTILGGLPIHLQTLLRPAMQLFALPEHNDIGVPISADDVAV
jgi:hypothetical protein